MKIRAPRLIQDPDTEKLDPGAVGMPWRRWSSVSTALRPTGTKSA